MKTKNQGRPYRPRPTERQALQAEIWSLRQMGGRLIEALTLVIVGNDAEQAQGVEQMIALVDEDIRIARRIKNILEANPPMRIRHQELYERAIRASRPPIATEVAS